MKITRDFDLEEFRCKDGSIDHEDNLQKLAVQLQVLRDRLGVPIIINSGYRSPDYNKAVGGEDNSYHMKGMAGDIRTKFHTPEEIYNQIEELIAEGKMKQGGLSAYNTFVHYDFRGTRARW